MRAMVVVLGLLGACSGDNSDDDGVEPIDSPPVEPPPDDTGTDTGLDIDGGSIDASFWAVTGRFVFDQDTATHVSYAYPGVGLVSMSLEFMLIDSSFLVNPVLDDSTRCLVIFEWDTPEPIAGWVTPHFAWTGLDMPDDVVVHDQCSEFFGLPGEWNGDAAGHLQDWSWGVGITELDPLVEDTLRNQLEESQWSALEPYIVGGAINSNFFTGSDLSDDGYTASGFAVGYEVDSNNEVVIGGTGSPEPLPKAYINSDPGVITGYYEVTMGPYTGGPELTNGGD
jgi:hypothetical protein